MNPFALFKTQWAKVNIHMEPLYSFYTELTPLYDTARPKVSHRNTKTSITFLTVELFLSFQINWAVNKNRIWTLSMDYISVHRKELWAMTLRQKARKWMVKWSICRECTYMILVYLGRGWHTDHSLTTKMSFLTLLNFLQIDFFSVKIIKYTVF